MLMKLPHEGGADRAQNIPNKRHRVIRQVMAIGLLPKAVFALKVVIFKKFNTKKPFLFCFLI